MADKQRERVQGSPVRCWWFGWRDVALWVLLGYFGLGLAAGARAQGALELHGDSGAFAALSVDTDVAMVIRGPVARVRVTQHFRNPTHDWMEGVYSFPLPETASIDGLELRIGERVIRGEVREKREAKRVYVEARDKGRRASLVTQQRPNLFTTRAANIGPGETVRVTLTYVQPAQWHSGAFELRFPMTYTPRFGAGDEPRENSRPVSGATPAGNGPPLLALNIWLDAGLPLDRVDSLHHGILQALDNGWRHITLEDQAVRADRDFVLRWQPDRGSSPRATAFSETVDGETYAMLMLVPPEPKFLAPAQREVIFVIDTSGSMHGASIEQAREALVQALERLTPSDRFNVIRFASETQALFPHPVPADRRNVNGAVRWVRSLESGGGTVMRPALEQALAGNAPHPWLRQVVFVTDGAVGNEQDLFSLIHRNLGAARLFTVGIGAAPNSWFMRKAAQFGHGTHTFIGDQGQVGARMAALFEQISHPAMQNLCIDWPVGSEQFPTVLPDLYAGEPLVAFARLDTLDGGVGICGKRAGVDWRERIALAESSRHAGIGKLWARRKIESLLDERVRGADENTVRKEVLAVALRHRLVSPYTALVAVDKTPARTTEALKQARLANAAPAGAGLATLPQTAAGLPGHALLGLLGVLLALFAWRLRHDVHDPEDDQ